MKIKCVAALVFACIVVAAAIVANNDDANKWTWMTRAELLHRWTRPGGEGWARVLFSSPPFPPPTN